MDIYDIKVLDRNNKEISLSTYKGKTILVVNTATGCGFTPQFKGLQELYDKYKDKDFVILDFPCNQFGNQTPGSDDEIHEFCSLNYNVSFPQFKKIDVNGKNESPLYTYLKSKKGGLFSKNIKWNFTKFLVDKNGNVIKRFAPTVTPEEIENKIKEVL